MTRSDGHGRNGRGLMLSACAVRAFRPAAPPPPLTAPLDASYDWHVLLLAPFGSVLKDVPLPLHEVLLFRDEGESRAAADERSAMPSMARCPRFMDQALDEYLLCFRHDRLSRIEATVRLPAPKAATNFRRCLRAMAEERSQASHRTNARVPRGDTDIRGAISRTSPDESDAIDRPARSCRSVATAPTRLVAPCASREREMLVCGRVRTWRSALHPAQTESLLRLVDELELGNAQFNLTAIRDRPGMLRKHVLDSLSSAPYLRGERSRMSAPGRAFRAWRWPSSIRSGASR